MNKYITSNWTWQTKDWYQQPLHFMAGALLVLAPSALYLSYWPAYSIASIGYGFFREYRQHPPEFVNVDSCFWTLGAVAPSLGILFS